MAHATQFAETLQGQLDSDKQVAFQSYEALELRKVELKLCLCSDISLDPCSAMCVGCDGIVTDVRH